MPEHRLGAANALLKDGELRRLELDGTAVVIACSGGEYYAFGADCTHYGAPLDNGVLKGHHIMCPWHHACFDIRSGKRVEPPALNDLPHFPVRIENGEVIVTLPHENATEPQGESDPTDQRHFVIVGGGAAGNAASEELRRSGFRGKITIISQVQRVPIDRPNVSKEYLAGKAEPEWMPLRPDENWYAERDIQLRLGKQVTGIDPKAHTVQLDNGETVHYDKLLLATGGIPRQLKDVPGANLKGVFVLRTQADADKIIEVAQEGKRAVIIGASFIGMEAAASLLGGRKVAVTVVGIEAVPFERIFGAEIGRMFQQEHEANGVQFCLNAEVQQLTGQNGQVTGVQLKSGEVLPADFVILGIGVQLATDFLKGSGVQLNDKDGSVRVGATLQSSDPDIYAAGDIARWDNGSAEGVRIEHWRVAQQHGIIAARNMLGLSDIAQQHVPFFWTAQWKINLRYVGYTPKWDEIIYRYGTPEQKNFIAFYLANGKLQAAAGVKHDPEMDAVEFILRDGMPLTAEQMWDTSFDLVDYARSG